MEFMKEITRLVNDTKRNQENAKALLQVRDKIEGLTVQEQELGLENKFLIMKQQVLKISNGRAQERHLFLLDKMLVYARENPVKKGFFQLKGRIPLDKFIIQDIPSSAMDADTSSGVMKHAWLIVRDDLNAKKYTIVNKTLKDKKQWLEEIERAQSEFKRRTANTAN